MQGKQTDVDNNWGNPKNLGDFNDIKEPIGTVQEVSTRIEVVTGVWAGVGHHGHGCKEVWMDLSVD